MTINTTTDYSNILSQTNINIADTGSYPADNLPLDQGAKDFRTTIVNLGNQLLDDADGMGNYPCEPTSDPAWSQLQSLQTYLGTNPAPAEQAYLSKVNSALQNVQSQGPNAQNLQALVNAANGY